MWRGAFPDIDTGRYRAQLRHAVALDGQDHQHQLADVDVRLDVEGPRVDLPGPEIHSVFPPANADGRFDERLPHIALKRRTLPWERSVVDGNTEPWLALVVLADFEGMVTSGPIRDAFTPAALSGLRALPDGTCQRLEVTSSVVEKVFPTREELPWLTHVRQVSLLDAENLRGDLDGWLSVVVANRLPARQDTAYGAYLVSLEGQLGALPQRPSAPTHQIGPKLMHEALADELVRVHEVARLDVGIPGDRPWLGAGRNIGRWGSALEAEARDVEFGGRVITRDRVVEIGREVAAGGIAFTGGDDKKPALKVVDWVRPILVEPTEQVLRFPVLASWSFRTESGKDFKTLMKDLQVGLVSSTRKDVPPVATDTGHTRLAHRTREGESEPVWYRGPLAPVQTARRAATPHFEAAAAVALVGPADGDDGRVMRDLSEAAAFEIGRLLALSDPAFLEALSRWRRDGFTVRRRRQWEPGRIDVHPWIEFFDEGIEIPRRRLQFEQLRELLGGDPPVVDPVEHLALFDLDDDVPALAEGFALPQDQVRALLQPGWTTRSGLDVRPGAVDGGLLDADLDVLGRHLDSLVGEAARTLDDFDAGLAAEALRRTGGGP